MPVSFALPATNGANLRSQHRALPNGARRAAQRWRTAAGSPAAPQRRDPHLITLPFRWRPLIARIRPDVKAFQNPKLTNRRPISPTSCLTLGSRRRVSGFPRLCWSSWAPRRSWPRTRVGDQPLGGAHCRFDLIQRPAFAQLNVRDAAVLVEEFELYVGADGPDEEQDPTGAARIKERAAQCGPLFQRDEPLRRRDRHGRSRWAYSALRIT